MFKKEISKKYLDGAIYSIVCIENMIIVSLGVGIDQKKNRILVFAKPKGNNDLKDHMQLLDVGEEVIEKMKYCPKRKIIVSNSQAYCVLFKLKDGNLELFQRFKTDFAVNKSYQHDGLFNYEGDTLATGGEDGVIKFWKVGNDVLKEWELKEEVHKINSLDFHINFKLLIAACDNFECKIINYEKRQVVKKLTITDKNIFNLKFAVAYFSQDEQHIYAINNPNAGASYLTVWKMEDNNVTPISTKQICSQPITSSCMSAEGMFLGVGGFDGSLGIINLRYFDFECQYVEQVKQPRSIKSVAFAGDSRYLMSACSDQSYHFLTNARPEGWFSKLTKLWVLSMFVIYIANGVFGIHF